MLSFASRLTHQAKTLIGTLPGRGFSKLHNSGRGPTSRVVSVDSAEAQTTGVVNNIRVSPRKVEIFPPQYFLDGRIETEYRDCLRSGSDFTRSAGVSFAQNVDVSLPTGMHQIGKHVLQETMPMPYLLTNPKYYFALEAMRFRRKRRIDEGVLLAMPWGHNFYHWMIDSLPRLLAYDRSPQLHDIPIILPKSAPGFVAESLKLTGYRSKAIFLENGVYRFRTLHMLTMLSDTPEVSPDAIEWLNSKFSEGSPKQTGPKRIYVSRKDAKIRFVSNEAQLANVLSEFGFETVVTSDLSLEKQVDLFRQAEYIIGPHGAGFANLAFARPGSTFVEFFPRSYFSPSYNRIAGIRGLKYGFIIGEPTVMGGYAVKPRDLQELLTLATQPSSL